MKIKCDKTVRMWDIMALIGGLGACAVIILKGIEMSGEVTADAMITVAIMFSFFARLWLVDNRTLIMDEEGCTVCFWFIRKKYPWKKLRVKRIEHYSDIPGGDYYYTDGAVFSVHRIHKPRWLYARIYSWMVHPFSCFFVYFSLAPDIRKKVGEPRGGSTYEVDEEMFLEKLKSWNVELEDTRVRRRRRRI